MRDHEEDVDAGVELDGGAEGAGVVADPEGELVGVCCSIYIYIYIILRVCMWLVSMCLRASLFFMNARPVCSGCGLRLSPGDDLMI